MKKTLVSIKKVISQFDIADRFLILFMLILYLYMMYNLFAGAVYSDDNNAINIITRTSSASIFGYFISGNFAKKNSVENTSNTKYSILSNDQNSNNSDNYIENKIGFQTSSDMSEYEKGNISFKQDEPKITDHPSKKQIIIVSLIGIFSLTALIMTRHYQDTTPELTAIISQFRDFISACIGFLIGCKKK